MNCTACHDLMMDVLYGENTEPRQGFEFFSHLQQCDGCQREYLELLETRDLLSTWEIEEEGLPQTPAGWPRRSVTAWIKQVGWPVTQRIAAAFLMLVGVAALAQAAGLWQSDRVTVSRDQLMQMVNDMFVLQETEQNKRIGRALVDLADEVNLSHRVDLYAMDSRIFSLEKLYLENDERLQVLLTEK